MRAPPADLFSSMKRDHPAAINAAPPGADTIMLRLDPTKPQTYTNQGNQQTFTKVLTKMYPVSNLTPSGIAVDTGNYAGVVARGVRPRWSKAPQFLDDKYGEEEEDDDDAAVASPDEVDDGYAKIEDWSPAVLERFRAEASHRLDYVRAKAMELTDGIADPKRRVSLGVRDCIYLHKECNRWLRCPRYAVFLLQSFLPMRLPRCPLKLSYPPKAISMGHPPPPPRRIQPPTRACRVLVRCK